MVPARSGSCARIDAGESNRIVEATMAFGSRKHFTTKDSKTTKGRELFIQHLSPFRADLVFQFFARFGDRRKLMSAVVGNAGIYETARAVAFVFRRNADIEGAAGAAAQNLDGMFRFTPGGDGPQHIEFACGIDVVVDDHHESAVVSAAHDLGSEEERLARMTGISLFDGNYIEETADTRLQGPDSFDVRQSGFFYAVPYLGRANHSLRERIIRRRATGTRDAQYRVIAIMDPLNLKYRRIVHPRAIVAKPLAERAVGFDVSRIQKSLDSNFCVGGKWQSGDLTFDQIERPPSNAAAVIVL